MLHCFTLMCSSFIMLRASYSHFLALPNSLCEILIFHVTLFHLNVLFFHHVESLGRIVEDAVEDVHHARALSSGLRPEFAEKPVQPLGLSKLGTVGVVATNDGSWNKKTDFIFTYL